MKLGKLLAAGKSIMNGHTEISYRSTKQIYLPKFGTFKNPFKSEAPAQAAEITPAETERPAQWRNSRNACRHREVRRRIPTAPENSLSDHRWVMSSNKPKSPEKAAESPQIVKNSVNSGSANP